MLASASMALLLASQVEPGRLRTILPNGIRLQVEATNHHDRAAVAMAVSLAGLSQDDLSQGKVHLLEHLSARGPQMDLDQRLEEQGMGLSVITSRDAMVFRISCRPRQASFALESLVSLFQPLTVTEAEIAREVAIMQEEKALREGHQMMARAAWKEVFTEEQADPMGFPEPGQVTPEALTVLHRRLFEGRGISIALIGGIDESSAFDRAKSALQSIPAGSERGAPLRSAALKNSKLIVSGMSGAGRAVLCEGIDSTSGLAVLGAAMAISAWLEDARPFYTPSLWRGLVYVTAESPATFQALDRLTGSQREGLQPLAASLLQGYFRSVNRSPEAMAELQSALALQNPTLTLKRLADMAKAVTPSQVGEAVEAFTDTKALKLEGGL